MKNMKYYRIAINYCSTLPPMQKLKKSCILGYTYMDITFELTNIHHKNYKTELRYAEVIFIEYRNM